jgi:lipopolysaccharide assembly outer membrane protein LptD (OstA)
MRWTFLVLALALTAPFVSSAQTGSVPPARTDTARSDSLTPRQDTSSVSGVDTVVNYSSVDSIVYALDARTMELHRNATLRYRDMELRSERIDVNWNAATMYSFGVPDSADTSHTRYRGTPVMKDGGEEYRGHALSYNFKTKKGKLDVTDTKIDEGYYHGEEIKRMSAEVLFVEDGRYTTCDAPHPHYYFASPRMKVIVQDKVIAEPVYLYIADVPLFALPLGVFPNRSGRRSGIIAPAIVENASLGRLLHHLGYYWAISDYMDLSLRTDLYTRGSWSLQSDYRYALRYSFTGAIGGQYRKIITGETSDPARSLQESYQFNLTHNQTIDPTMRLDANLTFASNNSYLNTIDVQQALQQSIYSRAALSKAWEGTPNSMSISVSRNQILTSGNIDETLPAIGFNHSQSYPLRFGSSGGSEEGRPWYEMIGFSYGANASNNRAKRQRAVPGIRAVVDGRDTTVTVQDYEYSRSQSITQDASLSIAPKLGYFSITPHFSYSDQRTFSSTDVPGANLRDSSVTSTTVKESRRVGTLSTGIAVSTKLYGILQPGLFGIGAIRHTFAPSLSVTHNKQIIGNEPAPGQMLMAFNVGNIFEMKTAPEEEGKEPKRIQLLNFNAGVSYNFLLDSLKFSPIGVGYRTGIGNLLDIGGSASFNLYKLEQVGPASYVVVNKFLLKEEGRLARLTDFSINLSTSLSGEKKSSTATSAAPADSTRQRSPGSGYYGLYREEDPDFSIPWQLTLRFDYSEHKVQPFPSRSASLNGSIDFNLTDAWKFTASSGYDLMNREILVPQVNISRDLHCWIMNFYWVPNGPSRQYRLEIRVKAPQLQDIKVTKQGSERGIY